MMSPSSPPVLDRAEGLRRVRGDEKLYKELIDLFRRDVPRLLEMIDTAIARQSASALRCAAHSLRGSSSQIGAGAVAQRALALEQLAKANELHGVEEQQRFLREAIQALAQALHAEFGGVVSP